MESTGASTAIMFAVAAVLWFAYLIPTWFRRREYLATERNATRLQQTLRVLAETAEIPQQVRVEASARGAAHQAKLLREQERQRAERERIQLARVRAAQDPAIVRAAVARRRLRRSRLVVALVLVASLITVGVQATMVVGTTAVTATWVLLGSAALTSALCLGTLRRLARRRVAAPVTVGVPLATAAPARPSAARTSEEELAQQDSTWTPVPVPKPLYLSKPAPQRLEPTLDAERLMREASAAAERALRAALAEPEVLAFPTPATPAVPAASANSGSTNSGSTTSVSGPSVSATSAAPAAPSRWATMGIVDPTPPAVPDLDEVLRRRRAAG